MNYRCVLHSNKQIQHNRSFTDEIRMYFPIFSVSLAKRRCLLSSSTNLAYDVKRINSQLYSPKFSTSWVCDEKRQISSHLCYFQRVNELTMNYRSSTIALLLMKVGCTFPFSQSLAKLSSSTNVEYDVKRMHSQVHSPNFSTSWVSLFKHCLKEFCGD